MRDEVVGPAELDHPVPELLRDEAALDAPAREVERERGRGPGAAPRGHTGLLVHEPEAREPHVEVGRRAACRPRALLEELERPAHHLGRHAETHDHAVADAAGDSERLRAVGRDDDRDPPTGRPGKPDGLAAVLGLALSQELPDGDDVLLEQRQARGLHTQVPDSRAARTDADVHTPGGQVVDARRRAGGHDRVAAERVGHPGAEADALRLARHRAERDPGLAEERRRVPHADAVVPSASASAASVATPSAGPGVTLKPN